MVLGAAGYGKSLLADLVAEQLDDRLDVVKLQSARLCSRRALLQNILFELELPYRELSEGELRLSILDRLEPSPETAPEGILVVVDEAHTLHWKLLEELRLISNYTRNGHPRVRLLLLGNLRLEEIFTTPQMDSFNQRLAARCYLQPMNREETFEFIKHQFRQSSEIPESKITPDALEIVHSACEGIPRLVNQLMDYALVMASDKQLPCINADVVSEAWADLQQLPTPWTVKHSDAQSDPVAATVEFGQLEEIELQPTEDRDGTAEAPSSHAEGDANFFSAFTMDWTEPAEGNDPATEENEPEISDIEEVCGSSTPESAAEHFTEAEQPASAEDPLSLRIRQDESFTIEPSDAETSQDESFSGDSSDLAALQDASLTNDSSATEATQEVTSFPELEEIGLKEEVPTETEASDFQQERIECLEQEQEQYSEMGMWEDDPPLLDPPLSDLRESLPELHSPNGAIPDLRESTAGVFGDDFDQEIEIPTLAAQQPAGTNYLARMEGCAKFLSELDRDPLASAPPEIAAVDRLPISSETDDQAWSINIVAESGRAEPLEDSIEDIVSQLNFSAFSIEPFSVEQIPLHAEPGAVEYDPAEKEVTEEISVDDGDGKGCGGLVPARTIPINALASHSLEAGSPVVDDDRDILIIEEDVPAASRLLDQDLPSEPAQKTVPYAQLFAKLRK